MYSSLTRINDQVDASSYFVDGLLMLLKVKREVEQVLQLQDYSVGPNLGGIDAFCVFDLPRDRTKDLALHHCKINFTSKCYPLVFSDGLLQSHLLT